MRLYFLIGAVAGLAAAFSPVWGQSVLSANGATASSTSQQPLLSEAQRQRIDVAEAKANQFAQAFRASNGTAFPNVDSSMHYAAEAVLALQVDQQQTDFSVRHLLNAIQQGTDHDGLLYYAIGYLYEHKPTGSDWPNALKWYRYAFQVRYEPAYFRLLSRYRQLFSVDNVEWITANNTQQVGLPVACRLSDGTQRDYTIYLNDVPQNPTNPIEQETRRLQDVFGVTPTEADRARFARLYQQAVRQKISFNNLSSQQVGRRNLTAPSISAPVSTQTPVVASEQVPPAVVQPVETPVPTLVTQPVTTSSVVTIPVPLTGNQPVIDPVAPPTASERLVAVGDAFYTNRQYGQAIEQYAEAVKVGVDATERAWSYTKLGNAYLISEQYAQAVEAYRAGVAVQERAGAYLGLSVAYRLQKNYAEALSAAQRAVALRPTDPACQRALGAAYYANGKFQETITASEQSLQTEPGNAEALLQIGQAQRSLGRYIESLTAFDKAMSVDPARTSVYQYNKGLVYKQQTEWATAIGLFAEAVKAEPNNMDYQQALATAYVGNKQWPQAEELYKKLIEQSPNNADSQHGLGQVYAGNGQYAEALVPYQKAVELAPTAGRFWQDLGEAQVQLKQYEPAVTAFRKALVLTPALSQSNLLDQLALSLTELKRLEECLSVFDQAMQAKPQQATRYRYEQVRIYLQLNQPTKAIPLLRQLVVADPADVDYLHTLAQVYTQTKQGSAALSAYKKLTELAPNQAGYQLELGDAYDAARQYQPAIACYQKAIALAPNQIRYHQKLGEVAFAHKDYDLAANTFQSILTLDPTNSEGLQMLGQSLTYLQRYEDGLTCFRKGIEQFEADRAASFGYGMATNYALQGKVNEAIAALDLSLGKFHYKGTAESIRSNPDFSGIRESPAFKTLLTRYFPK